MAKAHNNDRPIKVLHFVTGGFSGATQVAIDLVKSASNSEHIESLLVLRRKRQTPQSKIQALIDAGISVKTVSGLAHSVSIYQLWRICKHFRPDFLVAHGFSEHIIGRYAGLLAGVPRLIHVEHNSRERYTFWRLVQSRWLAKRTAAIVGVSDGVKTRLLELKFPADRVISIPNGINLTSFADAQSQTYEHRAGNIVMCARFSAQKDHETALRAMKILKDKGHAPLLYFAGGGKLRYLNRARELTRRLGLDGQVKFLGLCSDIPSLLKENQIFLLSTHYEGMPLALIEGMAAGCAVVASNVVGVKEIVQHDENGLLVAEADPEGLAAQLERLLTHPELGQALSRAAIQTARSRHSIELMQQRYEALFIANGPNNHRRTEL